jgi:hypothetical protein
MKYGNMTWKRSCSVSTYYPGGGRKDQGKLLKSSIRTPISNRNQDTRRHITDMVTCLVCLYHLFILSYNFTENILG